MEENIEKIFCNAKKVLKIIVQQKEKNHSKEMMKRKKNIIQENVDNDIVVRIMVFIFRNIMFREYKKARISNSCNPCFL